MILNLVYLGVGVFALLLILGLLSVSFVSAKPDEIKVISGLKDQRILHGKTGWKIPLIERVDTMTASMIPVDVKIQNYVPTNDFMNVTVDAAVKVQIITENKEHLKAATRNFLYKKGDVISQEVGDTIEGHLRAIIGQMPLAEIVTNKVLFSEKVQENATKDLEEMGLRIIAFNIQSISDDNDIIKELGTANKEQVRKESEKSRAIARQEIAAAQAKSDLLSNEARVNAELEIAKRDNELIKIKASLTEEAQIAQAKADIAYDIAKQSQRKSLEIETANAEIAKQEKEAEIAEKMVSVTQQKLASEIKAKADADKYRELTEAEAKLAIRKNEADTILYEEQKQAELRRIKSEADLLVAEAEAKSIKIKGEAEAEATRLKLEAEADGLNKKAEAMSKYSSAAVTEMIVNVLPQIAESVAKPLSNIDSITMYGEGNQSKLVGDIMKTVNTISSGFGLDIVNTISGALDKTPKEVTQTITDNPVLDLSKEDESKDDEAVFKKPLPKKDTFHVS